MASNFCEICGDILVIDHDSKENLTMKCEHCNKLYDRQDDIVLFKKIATYEHKIKNIIKHAIDDVKNPREYRYCEDCKAEKVFVRIVIPDGSLKNIYLCTDCKLVY